MYSYDERRRWSSGLGFVVAVVVIAAGGFVMMRGTGGGQIPTSLGASAVEAGAPESSTTVGSEHDTVPAGDPSSATSATSATSTTSATSPTSTTSATSATVAIPDELAATSADEPASTTAPPGPGAAAASTSAESDDERGADPGTETSGAGLAAPPSSPAGVGTGRLGYPASPDGAPLPIVATYDVGTVTLSGQVPSEATRERLVLLAAANSQDDAEVVDRLVVNDRVPLDVGVRVIEMNSARFPAGKAVITAEHAAQLDRVAAIMRALPHVTVLVIGHADQRGDEAVNFALSDERARAVVDYLVYLGVEPTRVSSRAAGETDLLTLDDDAAALALNRRTEFVFTGVLVG